MPDNVNNKEKDSNTDSRIRYLRLNQVFNKALSQSIAKFQNYDKLSSCFPDYSSTHLGKIHLMNCEKQVTEFWRELCHREFQEIMKERHVKEKLDDLDDLINQARKRLEEKEATEREGDQAEETTTQLSVADLSIEQIIQCNLHAQRKDTLEELEKRIEIIDDSNNMLEKEMHELEVELENEYEGLNDIYNQYFGQLQNQSLDKTLTQGLHDMLLETRES